MKLSRHLLTIVLLAALAACGEPDRPSIALYLAVQRGDIDQLERHIYWKTDIDAELPNGRYPLQIAAEKGRIVMVRTLLRHGATIDQRSEDGASALDLAILAGRTQLAELLIKEGAQLDPSELLIRAATQGVTDRDTVGFLIDRGADTEHRDDTGDTALLITIRQDNHRMATHLVNRGADVDAKTAGGQSALALATRLNTPELISLLRRQGGRLSP